jgi:hypothetical protein
MSEGESGRRTDSASIASDSSIRVLDLDVLVTHQRPSREVASVKLERSAEVDDGLLVLAPERVVVACASTTRESAAQREDAKE